MDQAALDQKSIRRAQRLNPYYKGRLGWSVPAGWPEDVSSAAFAKRVAELQAEHGGLTVDGILGAKTWAALKGETWEPPTGDHLIVAGEHVPVPFPVVTWDEPGGLSFYGQRGWRKRLNPSGKKVDLFVLHWDVCTSAHQCFHVLLTRCLSVHLMLDGDGTVYQALDLAEARAWHAGNFNDRSIGVEIQNPVLPKYNHTQKPPRPVITEQRVHRRGTWQHLDFHDIQKQRAVELAEVICERFDIPRILPMDGEQVSRRLAAAGFRGVCGHYHLSKNKPDPGLSLWPGLLASFGQSTLNNGEKR